MSKDRDFQNQHKIKIGNIVRIKGTSFDKECGIVVDVKSKLEPRDGLIAVYFDREVPSYLFGDLDGARHWKHGIPTLENYMLCPRIICFELKDFVVLKEFPTLTLARRVLGSDLWGIRAPNFPFVSGIHPCHFADCSSGELATERTFVNIWGTGCLVYACQVCHKEKNGMWGEILELKDPLPGTPLA